MNNDDDSGNDRGALDDEHLERLVSGALRVGLAAAGLLVLAGTLLMLARHGHAAADYRLFRGEPTDLQRPAGILRDAAALSARGIIQLGLLILIATPIARVAFAAVGFARQRDRLYFAIALAVLAALLWSLLRAHG
jgi:uncharacterized membrane protein